MNNINDTFARFAACFVGSQKGDGEILNPEQLERDKLDYSPESLRLVDDYLTYLHYHRPEQMELGLIKTVLWGGAYVGEVIRRHSSQEYTWVDFDDYIPEHPQVTEHLGSEKQLVTCALLTTERGFTLPLNEIMRLLHEGPEDSMCDYAKRECGIT